MQQIASKDLAVNMLEHLCREPNSARLNRLMEGERSNQAKKAGITMHNAALPVHIQTFTLHAPRVTIYYPQIIGLHDRNVQHKLNQALIGQMQGMIKAQGYWEDPANTEMLGNYEVKTNERNLLSIVQTNYAYRTGMAHGLTFRKALTADVTTGTIYELKDLFKPGSDYTGVLSAIIKVQIKQRDIPTLGGFTAIRPDQDFYIADKALVVFFQAYEITPYYVGTPMFPISVYDLQSIIRDLGPLDTLSAE